MGAPFLLGGISSKQALHYGLGVLNPGRYEIIIEINKINW